jgi:FkbM family methyltransferase
VTAPSDPGARLAAALSELRSLREETRAALARERTRRRGALVRRLHELERMLDPSYAYSSQAGQDAVVDRLLEGRPGTFVDLGGHDGVTGSNTLFLETRRGWTGVLVEPVPALLARARAARRCPCLPFAVAASDGEAEFIEVAAGYTQMSGLSATYDPALLARLRAHPRHQERRWRVETRTLARLLLEADLPDPDFVSLDIEGGEEAALAAFPFERHRVRLWAIENNSGSPAIARIMRAAGHDLVEFCGPDELWLRRDLSPRSEASSPR